MALTIRTNKHSRPILYWHELTEKEKKEFNFLDTEQRQDESNFFRYRGEVYYLGDFMLTSHPEFKGWDGYQSDSYFSGILIKFTDGGESLIAATYFS